jgi:hypothetical protein
MLGEPRLDNRKTGGLSARERDWLRVVVAELLELRRSGAADFDACWEKATARAGDGGVFVGFTREACRREWSGEARGVDLGSAAALLTERDGEGREAGTGRVIA